MSEKKLRLELLVAGPPTKKCKELIQMYENFVSENPLLRLDVYYAGSGANVPTTKGFKKNIDKRIKIPLSFINGKTVPKDIELDAVKIRILIDNELKLGSENWDE